MVFQTVEIKILKKKVGLNAFLNYCKKDMDNFMVKQISILFLTFPRIAQYYTLEACNNRRIPPKQSFECIFPRTSHSEWQKAGSKDWIRMGRFESNERHPLVKRCLATAHVSFARKKTECLLFTPAIHYSRNYC